MFSTGVTAIIRTVFLRNLVATDITCESRRVAGKIPSVSKSNYQGTSFLQIFWSSQSAFRSVIMTLLLF